MQRRVVHGISHVVGFVKFFRKISGEVRGNAIWDGIKWLGAYLWLFLGSLAIAVMTALVQLLRSQPLDFWLLGVVFVCSSVFFIFFALRAGGRPLAVPASRKDDREEPFLPPPLPPIFPRADIEGEILDVILGDKFGPLFLKEATYILIHLRVVNRGLKEMTIVDWALNVQFGSSFPVRAEKVSIPSDMKVQKTGAQTSPAELFSPEPLDRKAEEMPLKQDIPLRGWVLFELSSWSMSDPRGGKFRVRLTDSLNQVHEVIKEPSPFVETGKIIRGT